MRGSGEYNGIGSGAAVTLELLSSSSLWNVEDRHSHRSWHWKHLVCSASLSIALSSSNCLFVGTQNLLVSGSPPTIKQLPRQPDLVLIA